MAPQVFCLHCNTFVSKRTATRHRQQAKNEDSSDKDDLVYCTHCSAYVSKRTQYRHSLISKHQTVLKSGTDDPCSSDPDPHCNSDPDSSDTDEDMQEHNETMSAGLDPNTTDSDSSADEVEEQNTDEVQGTVVWDDISDVENDTTDQQSLPVAQASSSSGLMIDKLVTWIIMTMLALQQRHNLSNAVVQKLFQFIRQFMSVLQPFGSFFQSAVQALPNSILSAWKYLKIDRDNFTKYIVCPNCCALHKYDKVFRNVNDSVVSAKCDNLLFDCRTVGSSTRRKGKFKCNSPLARQVELKNGRIVSYPLKVYCYKGVMDNLEQLLARPDFLDKCNAWRSRNISEHVYADVFDGSVWKSFIDINFLSQPYHFGFMLNVDWFQPYDRRRDVSIGALYIVIMNLPREERFKPENVLLIGIIPALSKEPESLNSFLKPLVIELKALWKGVLMNVSGYTSVTVKAALMCAAADIPAARKLCGFLGHAAIQGCSYCTKPQRVGFEPDCGLPDLSRWPLRNKPDHVKWSQKAARATCLTEQKSIEKSSGYRFTELLELPYFEPSKMTVVDPMHNLFLGTAKKMFTYWVESDLIKKDGLSSISQRIELLNVSSDIGRIPVNISTNFGQMTAKELKNWVLIYSMFCLKGVLPESHLLIWQTFVLACRHLCQPCITIDNLKIADKLLTSFCRRVIDTYGSKFVTPNMHLHCHLFDSVCNYGSLYGFWLFSFERYNGILADFPTNKRCIEIQLMRKFMMYSVLDGNSLDGEYDKMFKALCCLSSSKVLVSSLDLALASTVPIDDVLLSVWSDTSLVSLRDSGYVIQSLSLTSLNSLAKTYACMYKQDVSLDMLSSFCHKFSSIQYNNETIGSESYKRSSVNLVVLASWTDCNTEVSVSSQRPARVKYFIRHPLELSQGHIVNHTFAFVEWFKFTDETLNYKNPLSVWSLKCQNDGPASFLPIQRVHVKCAWTVEVQNRERFLVVSPMYRQCFL